MIRSRKKKLYLNTAASVVYQCLTVLCGMLLPRCLLLCYGSKVNGLVNSVTQFLGLISLAECGVGAVVQSALYGPLADQDALQVSGVFRSAKRFFRKIALVFLLYVVFLLLLYPSFVAGSFDYLYTSGLILILSGVTFVEYCFTLPYRLLLNADQLGFIQLAISSVVLLLRTGISLLIMKCGGSIHAVKLAAFAVMLIQPLAFKICADKIYKLDQSAQCRAQPIRQKWNGLAQHVAAVVLNNTDTVVLTVFSTLENVSIYHVYYFIVSGIQTVSMSMIGGMQALFGNMLARQERERLNQLFDLVEWGVHASAVLLFTMAGILIVPFVRVYTSGLSDASYDAPVFAVLLTAGQAVRAIRAPYFMLVSAAGHYKETQRSAIIETVLNLTVSVLLVFRYGLIGVAAGTLLAMSYRTLYFIYYLKGNIVYRPVSRFIKNLIRDIITIFLSVLVTGRVQLTELTYSAWLAMAVKVGLVSAAASVFLASVFNRREIRLLWDEIRQ